jgi:two-component system heavy metal sensor histidine kinase CusS
MKRIPGVKLNSLTFRLTVLFAMTVIILLVETGTFLYRFLDLELMKRDHEELIGKVDLFRHQLSAVNSLQQILAAPGHFRDFIIGHPHLRLALLDERGNILLSSSDWKPPPELLKNPVAIDTVPSRAAISMPTLAHPYHLVAAWGALGGSRTSKVLIILTLDVDEAQSLLARYGQTLLITMLFSGIAAASLGFFIARRGLRPLHTMAETASEISSSHLQKRLSVADAPAELKELAGAFNAMLVRLHSSFARLSDFSSDLAHELRTPINNLMGQTQVALSRTRNAEEYRAVLESNLEEYERLARMIRDMFFLAKADNAQEPLHAELLDLRVEMDKIAEFYQMVADENGLRIIPSGSGAITADRILLQRAIGNLISNAVQHSPPNSEVHAMVSSTDETVELRVSNHGPGIPVEHLERVFDRFYRIDKARGHTDTDSGLGLAIVKSIMKLHDGHVSVESQPNLLTTFTLHFPKSNPPVPR